jgi:hypothetical protein
MFLTITPSGGSPVRIPVAYPDGDGEVGQHLVGDPGEHGVHGQYMSAVRARKLGPIPVTTRPMTSADADAARAALESAPPVPCGGEWIELIGGDPDYFEVIVGAISQRHVSTAEGRMVVLRFELTES